MLNNQRILLIISGGISAYKSPELIRKLRQAGARVRCILTSGGSEFVTPLTLASLSGDKVYSDLFSLNDESEMGHIRLSRETDLIVVAPASANILAQMSSGLSLDLATTTLLASNKPILVAPAMNSQMWQHPATQRNLEQLKIDGVHQVGPELGELACGETGLGRMAEIGCIIDAIEALLNKNKPLDGFKVLVTSGPTHEPLDPVRYISNKSSGKQGHAIAIAAAQSGADVTLVSGPTFLTDPEGVKTIKVTTAQEMMDACILNLPTDLAICSAAVSDWRPTINEEKKIKKISKNKYRSNIKTFELTENPDILETISNLNINRPRLVVGFAAETGDLINQATNKLLRKKCDWIVANDVSPGTYTFGNEENEVTLLYLDEENNIEVDSWPRISKSEVAHRLIKKVAAEIAIK